MPRAHLFLGCITRRFVRNYKFDSRVGLRDCGEEPDGSFTSARRYRVSHFRLSRNTNALVILSYKIPTESSFAESGRNHFGRLPRLDHFVKKILMQFCRKTEVFKRDFLYRAQSRIIRNNNFEILSNLKKPKNSC